jgi:hypothetical protein
MADTVLDPVKVQELGDVDIPSLILNGGYFVVASADNSKPPQKISIQQLASLMMAKIPRLELAGYATYSTFGDQKFFGIINNVIHKAVGVWEIYLNQSIHVREYTLIATAGQGTTTNPIPIAYTGYVSTTFTSSNGLIMDKFELLTADNVNVGDRAWRLELYKRYNDPIPTTL